MSRVARFGAIWQSGGGVPITIGTSAVSGTSGYSSGSTVISRAGPANASGTITEIDIYADLNMTGIIVATFYSTGTNQFTARDSYSIGSAATGYSTHTVSLDVEEGDYIGIYYSGGRLEMKQSTGQGYWYKSGDNTACTTTTFTLNTTNSMAISLYGIGSS